MDTDFVKEEANRATKPLTNGFIPKLVGKKVVIHLTSGGQPVTGTVERYNLYDLVALGHSRELVYITNACKHICN
jgi:hypothetical protein